MHHFDVEAGAMLLFRRKIYVVPLSEELYLKYLHILSNLGIKFNDFIVIFYGYLKCHSLNFVEIPRKSFVRDGKNYKINSDSLGYLE